MSTISVVWSILAMILTPVLTIALMIMRSRVYIEDYINIVQNIQITLVVYNLISFLDLIYSSEKQEDYEAYKECNVSYAYVITLTLIYAFFQLAKAETADAVIKLLLLFIIALIATIGFLIFSSVNKR